MATASLWFPLFANENKGVSYRMLLKTGACSRRWFILTECSSLFIASLESSSVTHELIVLKTCNFRLGAHLRKVINLQKQ